ncbi:hypothetical protein CFC21_009514 [Triticum aestivum]|uniref:Uncharacterized protein n=4 Tax=Triticum TaxID=4564 RepID=A0A9R0R6B1_TRITD|nr:uncharacterized protein LOC123101760 [Triticum aestivum]XP_044379003.1 uncharacterized protein LOC123101760 [Triticum aestivum]KAF6992531.1 hypothetical protein CFC21_009514 [Triticum aestivum]VAH23940.1 unnamed protein product [Triticum turgidum subsp. durum]
MAASLRAAATTRIPRPSVLRGQGLRRLVHAEDLSKSILPLDKEQRGPLVRRMGELMRLQASKFTHAMKEEHRAELVQLKKEQLYEVIALVDADSKTSLRDKSLLKDLSTQIEPRPHDPQWRKITRSKKVTKWTALAGILAINALGYCALPSGPEIVKYDGYLVTVESLPLIRQYQHAAERARKQDGYQHVATSVGLDKQEEM